MWKNLRKYFISGLIVFAPLTITAYLFFILINSVERFFSKIFHPLFYESLGFYFYGLSILVALYVIIMIGFLITNILGKRIYDFFERLLVRLPFFKQVYPALKEMVLFLFTEDRTKQFKGVVLVEYPRKGIYSMAFLMNDSSPHVCEKAKEDLCNVLIPSVPNPITGFVILVPKKDIIFVDISIEEAFKLFVSGGVVNPLK